MAILTARFRNDYRELEKGLREAERSLATLEEGGAGFTAWAASILDFFRDEVLAYEKWVEQVLYPVVDATSAESQSPSSTAALRATKANIEQQVQALGEIWRQTPLDVSSFVTLGRDLSRTVAAHLRHEEEALLPSVELLAKQLLATNVIAEPAAE